MTVYSLIDRATGAWEVDNERGDMGPPKDRDGKVWVEMGTKPTHDPMVEQVVIDAPVAANATVIPYKVVPLPDDEIKTRANGKINQQIQALTNTLTLDRIAAALTNDAGGTADGRAWMTDVNGQIAALRKQIVP